MVLKTEKEIREQIHMLKKVNSHVLTGSMATVVENAPRALMQLSAETKLEVLYWMLGEKYKSLLKKIK